jgi:hypothetical protein
MADRPTAEPRFPCQCCGCLTLSEDDRGSYEICPICFWEDDYVQNRDPDFRGGANVPSLNEARRNYARFGAIEERWLPNVRPPRAGERPAEHSA